MAVKPGTCNTFHQAVDTSNRFLGAPFQYDAAGNMIHDATHSYTYDAENRLIQVDGGATATYTYDPEGRRVAKAISGTTSDYVHELAGNVLFEAQGSSWVTTYIYFAGALHAQYKNNTTYFLHRDHLGSTRLVTGLTNPSLPVDNLDYLPFGEQIAGGTSTTHKFTGRERDAETGLDYFMARQMAPGLGRFLQPDPGNVGAVAVFPQTWHGYGYVANNPMANIDPYGLFCPATGCESPGEPEPPPELNPCDIGPFDPSCNPGFPCPGFLCIPPTPPEPPTPPPPPQQQPTVPNQSATQQQACTTKILKAVNNQFGTNFGPQNVQGDPFVNGQATNLNILGTGLPAAQFNSIQTGRYPVSPVTWLIGYGPTLHIAGPAPLDPAAVFVNSNVGGATSVLFTAHIDTSFAYNPIGGGTC